MAMNLIYRLLTSICTICLISLISINITAQTAGENYVMTIEPLAGSTQAPQASIDMSRVTVRYFDGLGREKSTVQAGASRSACDVADYVSYDSQGRVLRHYLSIAMSTDNGAFPQGNFPTQSSSYHGDSRAYTQTTYNPIYPDKVASTTGPGDAWVNRPMTQRHRFNTATGDFSCIRYDVATDGSLVNVGNYRRGTLRIEIATDEQGDSVLTFTDKSGRKLLQRRVGLRSYTDTHYVYDIYGRLRYILPPEASTRLTVAGTCEESVLNAYGYRYDYDRFNRRISSREPGAQPVYYVYDRIDRMVMSQTGIQRLSDEWTVTLHDTRHRPALEGYAIIAGCLVLT